LEYGSFLADIGLVAVDAEIPSRRRTLIAGLDGGLGAHSPTPPRVLASSAIIAPAARTTSDDDICD